MFRKPSTSSSLGRKGTLGVYSKHTFQRSISQTSALIKSRLIPPPRLLIRVLREFLDKNCSFREKIVFKRNTIRAVCPKELKFLNRYVEILHSITISGNVIRLTLAVEDTVFGNFSSKGFLTVGKHFKSGSFIGKLELFTRELLTKVKYKELELVGEIELMDVFVRGYRLDKNTLGKLYFETLLPLKRIDYYKYKKLRRVLDLRIKDEWSRKNV